MRGRITKFLLILSLGGGCAAPAPTPSATPVAPASPRQEKRPSATPTARPHRPVSPTAAANLADFRTPLEESAKDPHMLVTRIKGPTGEPVRLAVNTFLTGNSFDQVDRFYQGRLTGCQRVVQGGVVYLVPPGTQPGESLTSGSRVALSRTADGRARVFLEEFSAP